MSSLLEKFSTFLILILTIILLSNNLIMAQTNNDMNCHSSANPCIKINKLLKPCGETLPMPPKLNDTDSIQNVSYFVGNSNEAKCWCDKEFYDLLKNCTICLSGPSVNATVYSLDEYKNDCKKYGTEFKDQNQSSPLSTKTPSETSGGPNKLLIALGVSALVTLLASLAFCLFVLRRKKLKSRAYEKLKSDYYSSKGRGIDISGRNIINENDEKELYSPSVPMPPPLAHQPQQNEQQQQRQQQQQQQQQQQHQQQQQSMDQNQHNCNFNAAIYGEQQYYVEAAQAQVPKSSFEYSDVNNNQQRNYQNQ